jgi:hypothetical protein
MARYKEYQERAAECLRLAQSSNDHTNKALLLEMAQTWGQARGAGSAGGSWQTMNMRIAPGGTPADAAVVAAR